MLYYSHTNMLIFAQTLYYLVASFAIIAISALFVIIMYHLIHIAKHLRNIADNLEDTSSDLKKRIEEIIERLSELPILSFFLKRDKKRNSDKKGR